MWCRSGWPLYFIYKYFSRLCHVTLPVVAIPQRPKAIRGGPTRRPAQLSRWQVWFVLYCDWRSLTAYPDAPHRLPWQVLLSCELLQLLLLPLYYYALYIHPHHCNHPRQWGHCLTANEGPVSIQYKCPGFPFMYIQKWNCYFQNRIIMFYLPVPTLIYLWEIYIFTGSVCLLCCRKICGPILGIYKLLTDTWMWKLELRPHNSQKRNT